MSIRLTAQVQSNHKLSIDVPQLQPGETVRVVIEPLPAHGDEVSVEGDLAAWFASLPKSSRTLAEWEEYDKQLRADRDAWDKD